MTTPIHTSFTGKTEGKAKSLSKEELNALYASNDSTDSPNQGLLLKGAVIATSFSLIVYLVGYFALIKFIG